MFLMVFLYFAWLEHLVLWNLFEVCCIIIKIKRVKFINNYELIINWTTERSWTLISPFSVQDIYYLI